MRRFALTLLVAAFIAAGMQPAAAAKAPATVGLVSFTAASYSITSKKASLTIDWPNASRATKYQIFWSTSYDRVTSARVGKTTRASHAKITGLARGRDYFFQVRAVNGSKVGKKSKRVGHTTIRSQGVRSGPSYRVMTYNVCSRVCQQKGEYRYSRWDYRQPAAFERIAAFRPDVVAAQEADYLGVPPGYTQAIYKSGKRLFYRSDRFDLVSAPEPDTCVDVDSDPQTAAVCDTEPRTDYVHLGYHDGGNRYAVWAELSDRAAQGRRVIFVNVHTVTGDNLTMARHRRTEMNVLMAELEAVNTEHLPIVIAGDFNSHKNRSHDYVADVLNDHGFYDGYDLAETFGTRQHYNSYNDFRSVPKISYTWGDHVDHVWVSPGRTRVTGWRNGALIKNGRMVAPIPSDHSPIVVDVRVN